jgi:hypothetical protein
VSRHRTIRTGTRRLALVLTWCAPGSGSGSCARLPHPHCAPTRRRQTHSRGSIKAQGHMGKPADGGPTGHAGAGQEKQVRSITCTPPWGQLCQGATFWIDACSVPLVRKVDVAEGRRAPSWRRDSNDEEGRSCSYRNKRRESAGRPSPGQPRPGRYAPPPRLRALRHAINCLTRPRGACVSGAAPERGLSLTQRGGRLRGRKIEVTGMLLLPNQAKPVIRQQAPDATPAPAVRGSVRAASMATTCLLNCGALDPVGRAVCAQACL